MLSITARRALGCVSYCAVVAASGCLLPPTRMSTTPGASADGGDPRSSHNLLGNGTFDGGVSLPWTSSFTAPGAGDTSVVDGALCLDAKNAGVNRWDVQLRHREMVIKRGHRYRVSFRAWSDRPTNARPKVGMAGPPYAEYWADTIKLGTTPQAFSAEFVMDKADDETAELAFHAGAEMAASGAPFRLCIDDVVLEDPEFTRAAKSAQLPVPRVLVNQLGYAPGLSKIAVLKSDATSPLGWELRDGSGAVLAKGMTRVLGLDAASGDRLHEIDFSEYTQPGTGLRLHADGADSHPFAISDAVYARLRKDALAFFYHQRSGIEIRMPFAGDARFTRPAGHLGDRKTPCAPGSGCDYTLDASGGWYDAGDQGKYVVNGGIAVWTLLDLYERSAQSTAGVSAFGDRSLPIPEAGNGKPDLLDEARFELDFLLKMQVPAGQPLAGMVHHKLHDARWTELGTAPQDDREPRYLYPPTTAATLNVAAVAAQAARIFREIDPAYGKRCLEAARRAWQAALAHPQVLAPSGGEGGGAYDDRDLSDEFYWAAAELLVTTGDAAYAQFIDRSPQRLRLSTVLSETAADAGQHTVLTWQNTETAGTIALALAQNAALAELRGLARASLIKAADAVLAMRAHEGYRVPFSAGPKLSYPWGSNSFVLNNAIVLALAHDFSGEPKYRDAAISALDYLLGRNPLDQSYVTGYGARPLLHPHHRFFSHQIRQDRPDPPPGFVSGGPNSGLQDPYAKGAGLAGSPPQKCFIDHIESFSTNEVAINWNAPLAWLSAYADEQARAAAITAPVAAHHQRVLACCSIR